MAAFDLRALYESEADPVCSFLSRLGVRDAELEDAVHDTFLTAMHKASSYDASRPVRPWLFGIAFRIASARRRTAARRDVATGGDDAREPIAEDGAGSPERAVEARDARELVGRALEALSDDQRSAFVMYDLHGLSVAEISEAMQAPVATTYSRLRLARAAFAKAVTALQGAGGTA